MGRDVLDTVVSIVTAIVGLAIVSVLVSKNAQTGSVIKAAGSALAGDIQAATGPVTGGGGGFGGFGSGFGSFDTIGIPA
jgi:hypothetical protein